MPIYEFYCGECHTVYKFFSRSINTEKVPNCPGCGEVKLSRQVSTFATISTAAKSKEDTEGGLPAIDESKMERAMSMLAREAGDINEEDPRQAASLMRKLTAATGMKMGAGMEEALSRLERGEDPEKIEAEMGDLLEEEEPFSFEDEKKRTSGKKSRPHFDDTIYDL